MQVVLFFALMTLLILWASFWVIRLAVRYGVHDALRMNRGWLVPHQERREL